MDRKSILFLLAAFVLLLGWQPLVNRIWPPRPMSPLERASLDARTNQVAQARASNAAPSFATPSPAAFSPPAPGQMPAHTPLADAPSVAVLTNRWAAWDFVAQGAGIRSVALFQHRLDGTNPVVLNPNAALPIGALVGLPGLDDQPAAAEARGESVAFSRSLPGGVALRQEYRLVGDYQVALTLVFTNTGAATQRVGDFLVNCGQSGPLHPTDQALYIGADYHSGSKFHKIPLPSFDGSRFLWLFPMRAARSEIVEPGPIAWITSHSQFFLSLLERKDERIAGVVARRVDLPRFSAADPAPPHGVQSLAQVAGFDLGPGASRALSFEIYTGPREYSRLRALGSAKQDVMDFGLFGWVSVPLLSLMNALHRLPPHNFGLSIILMVIVIRGLFWIPQSRVNQNMKRVQAANQLPEVVKLREKYKDDPQRLNLEMMNVYRAYGVNPMGGCLPLLIQMPVFFGFYAMLQSAVELRGAPFLFIPDLSQPWTLFRLPGLGWPFNPLPLVMGLTSLWQMHITPTTSMDKTQAMILKFMPLMFVAFCYNFSSALALYWTAQNLVGIVQLYHSRNLPLPRLEKSNRPKSRWHALMDAAQAQAEAQRRAQGRK